MNIILQKYNDLVDANSLQKDKEQLLIIKQLDKLKLDIENTKIQNRNLFNRLFSKRKKQNIKGIYIYGGVGRGKSMLMDLFFANIENIEKIRIHFHEFMLDVHNTLHKLRNNKNSKDDILLETADIFSAKYKLLCFDEFHVVNITDAMILGRFFQRLQENGVIIVATSNWQPNELYKDGLQRASFLPFIDFINDNMTVIPLDSDIDYRVLDFKPSDTWLIIDETKKEIAKNKMNALFTSLSNNIPPSSDIFNIKKREVVLSTTVKPNARLDFLDFFTLPLAGEDFLTITNHYHNFIIENIPIMDDDNRNELKRFIIFIDILYEKNANVFISAKADLENIYQGKYHILEFVRTISRLKEMSMAKYLQN